MRKIVLFAAGLCLLLAGVGTSRADQCNGSGSCESDAGQLQCGPGTDAATAGRISAGATGAEYCNQGGAVPVQGRIGAQQDCECVYLDGDSDNTPNVLRGWLRVDAEGTHCRETGRSDNQTYDSSSGTAPRDCVREVTGLPV